MLNGVIARGTTPTHTFPLNKIKAADLVDVSITYRQKRNNVLIKRIDDVQLNDNNITVKLTQTDTIMFDPRFETVEVQVKVRTAANEVIIIDTYKYRLMNSFDEEEI